MVSSCFKCRLSQVNAFSLGVNTQSQRPTLTHSFLIPLRQEKPVARGKRCSVVASGEETRGPAWPPRRWLFPLCLLSRRQLLSLLQTSPGFQLQILHILCPLHHDFRIFRIFGLLIACSLEHLETSDSCWCLSLATGTEGASRGPTHTHTFC